jgi:hypothetical protein
MRTSRLQPLRAPIILLAVFIVPAWIKSAAGPDRSLKPGYLGISVPVSQADVEALDKAGIADVAAVCPAGGTDASRAERIAPFHGVEIGPISRTGRPPVAELHFPYGYDGLYAVLMRRACSSVRLTASQGRGGAEAVGEVPLMMVSVRKTKEPGPAPLKPAEYNVAVEFRTEESQIRLLRPGDLVDTYFVCDRWPEYMRSSDGVKSEKEWVSVKPANSIRTLDVSRAAGRESVTLEIWKNGENLMRTLGRECALFLARRAPGDFSSAGQTGVTLTDYGFGSKWRHWKHPSKK